MVRSNREIADRAADALCQPAFVIAVGLLLVNDHLLKGAGLFPGWLTGKLSDVAGLFFFPILLAVIAAAILRPRRSRTVWHISALAGCATALVFGLLNLSPSLAGALSNVWGTWTADPTDLLCLPSLAAAHVWFVRHVGAASDRRSRRSLQFAMLAVAAAASVATSKKKVVPSVEIQNERESSRSFVSSAASILVQNEEGGIERVRIDGSGRSTLVAGDWAFGSMSRDGRTIALLKHPGLYVVRGDGKPNKIPGIAGSIVRASVSPNGRRVGVTAYRASNWWREVTGGIKRDFAVYLVDVSNRKATEVRTKHDERASWIAWSSDGRTLFVERFEGPALAYDVEEKTWSETENQSLDFDELYHTSGFQPRECRDDGEISKLEPRRSGEDVRGLDLLRGKKRTTLVELDVTETPKEKGTEFSPPVGQYFFTAGCEYVVFELEARREFWVVDVDSRTVGRLGAGRSAWAVPSASN